MSRAYFATSCPVSLPSARHSACASFSIPTFIRLALALVLGIAVVARLAQFLGVQHPGAVGLRLLGLLLGGRRHPRRSLAVRGAPVERPYAPQSQGLYIFPPSFAVAMAPMAALFDEYRIANWLWAAVGAAILGVVVVAVARRERLAEGRDLALLLFAAFAFAPAIGELVMGNVHLLLLGLLAAAWLAIRRGTDRGEFLVGALLGVATLIKIFPGVLILWLVLTGRVRGAIAALATIAALALITLPFTGGLLACSTRIVLLNLGVPCRHAGTSSPRRSGCRP